MYKVVMSSCKIINYSHKCMEIRWFEGYIGCSKMTAECFLLYSRKFEKNSLTQS